MDIHTLYQTYLGSHTVTTDSRTITPGCLFFAFRGQHHDASLYIPQALQQGAALCITDNHHYDHTDRCLVVDNVLDTLQQLSIHHRDHLRIPVVGITGTNGKTTTKELVNAVLGQRYHTAATTGNHNNHLGVPLTLLAIPPDADIAIVEMGANHPGEISQLCHLANPTHGLITNVGRAHLEGFGSFEGVVQTKTELYRHLAANHGLAFVNADNNILLHHAQQLATLPATPSLLPAYQPALPQITPDAISATPLQLVTYGNHTDADSRGTCLGSTPYMKFYFEHNDNVYTVQTQLLGAYNFDNAMAAVAVGLHFGVDPYDIQQALQHYTPANHRSQLRQTATNTLYLDCYNANPTSMAAALQSFAASPEPHRSAIVGGMKELGHASRSEHQTLVDLIASASLDNVWLVGDEFNGIALPSHWLRFANVDQAIDHLRSHPLQQQTILIKGSNSNQLWRLEDFL